MSGNGVGIELELLCGVIDALPCPAALLSRSGTPAYVNPPGEELGLEDAELSKMQEVRQCLEGQRFSGVRRTLPGRNPAGGLVSGVIELYPVRNDERILGALMMIHPERERAALYISDLPMVSETMDSVRERLRRLSMLGTIAFILGEDGVGKESFARVLHDMGAHSKDPFIVLPGLGAEEKELKNAAGAAGNGSLFIERAEDMSASAQKALFALLSDKADGKGVLKGRLTVAATPELTARVRDGWFDKHLYQRIALMPVTIPPLRERTEDILPAAAAYLKRESELLGRDIEGFSPDTRAALLTNRWYGNYAELSKTVKAAVSACSAGLILTSHLPGEKRSGLQEQKKEFTKERILSLLDVYGATVDGKRKCARELGIGLSTLYRILGKKQG